MELIIPSDMPREEAKIQIWYPAVGFEDRGVSMEEVVADRTPAYLYNSKDDGLCDLVSGESIVAPHQTVRLGGVRIPFFGIRVGGVKLRPLVTDSSIFHKVNFRDVESALSFLEEKGYEGLNLQPAENYLV